MSRLRRAFTSEKKPTVPEVPFKPPLTAAQQANATYWDAVEEEHAIGLDSTIKGKGREIERLWGLENFGNTCYCNSVLQALYACEPFKHFIQSYPSIPPPVSPLGPGAGSDLFKALPLEKQVSMTNFNNAFGNGPASPVTVKSNPFDNPQLATSPSAKSPTPGGKEKRGWGGLGRKQSTSNAHTTSSNAPSQLDIPSTPAVSAPSPSAAAKLDIPIIVPDPNQPAPTVFETIQTLFHHLTTSPPHQPISVKKPDANSGAAQTASLLPVDGASPNGAPTPSLTATSNGNQPTGPPLLASLPPPSAPRAGGPYAAGSLGRGVVRPEDLLKTVKKENEMFRGMSQQDAHEFLGWLLNRVAEEVELLDKGLRANGKEVTEAKGNGKTFVQNLFEGVLTNETRCLSCETTSSRDELFLDLSIDIEQHTSVTSCLRQFSASEMLCQKNKFFCDSCCGLQEAEKRMKIKRLPNVLALHLKRFKYQENLGRYTKLFYRVPFPTQLKLPNTSDDVENPDRLYELFAVVVHIGNGPHHGHYVAMVRSAGRWVMCDDENIEPIDEKDIFRYFGDYPSGAGYVLFYQAVDLDLRDLGMKNPPKPTSPAAPSSNTMPSAAVPPTSAATAAPVTLAPVISEPVQVNGVPNLMDVEEEHEETPSHSPTKSTIPIPTSPAPASVPATPISVISNPQTPAAPSVNGSRAPVDRGVDRQIGFTPAPPTPAPQVEVPKASPALGADGQKPKKIPPPPPRSRSASSNLLSSPITPKPPPPAPSAAVARASPAQTAPTSTPAPAPASTPAPAPVAASTPTVVTTPAPAPVTGTASPTPPRVISNAAVTPSPNAMSSSVMSNFSQSSSNSSAQPPSSSGIPASYTTQSSLGRKPSTSNRDRNVSSSSNASGSNGTKLSRRLSGMSFKMGFGKKKDKENGIEEEDNKKTEKKGLLG